jgi:hypothetical protein
MNVYGRHEWNPRNADALLNAIVEEAIAETVAPAAAKPDLVEPISAAGFLADAAAFLRARPDAADLLRRLQAMVGDDTKPQSEAPQPAPETTPAPGPENPPRVD